MTQNSDRSFPPMEGYPEMKDFDWVQDYGRVVRSSKLVAGPVQGQDMPKMDINEVVKVMREVLARPEVMEAYKVPSSPEQEAKSARILTWHKEYLKHKYGTRPSVAAIINSPLIDLVAGNYEGLEDQKLIEKLLSHPLVTGKLGSGIQGT